MTMGIKQVQPKLLVNFTLDEVVPANHVLRRISEVVDFTFVRSLVRERYSKVGTKSIDPVVIFKLSLLGYLYNTASERRICERASYDMTWRWFLGYEIDEQVPVATNLCKARLRYGPEPYERFFAQTVKLCQEAGLISGDVLYLDATMSRANASLQSLRQRGLAEQLVAADQFVKDMWVANEDPEDAEPPRPKKPRGSGTPISGKPPRKSEAKANVYLVSATDPDAQLFRKTGVPRKLYHKTHFATDAKANVVTAVLVRPATEHDSAVMATMLDKHRQVVNEFPEAAVADKGYDSSQAATACLQRGVLPLVIQKKLANSKAEKKRDGFVFDAAQNLFTCSQGHQLRPWAEHFQQHLTQYRPPLRTCQMCPQKPVCAPGKRDRTLTRSWLQDRKETIAAMLETPTAKGLIRLRSQVAERTNADAKVRHCLERAQFRGRGKMWIQVAMTAATINLKKLATAPTPA